ncbi:MAG: hypothetical protein AB8B86_11585 [Pseudomonadales bacterium]
MSYNDYTLYRSKSITVLIFLVFTALLFSGCNDASQGKTVVEHATKKGAVRSASDLVETDGLESKESIVEEQNPDVALEVRNTPISDVQITPNELALMKAHDNWVFVSSSPAYDWYVEDPYCRTKNDAAVINIVINHRTAKFAYDEQWVVRDGAGPLGWIEHWGDGNYCLINLNANEKAFPVTVTSWHEGIPVSRYSFDYVDFQSEIANKKFELLVDTPLAETKWGESYARLQDIRLVDYANGRAILPEARKEYRELIDQLKKAAPPSEIPHITYLEAKEKQLDGIQGTPLYELASSMGHGGATQELIEITGLYDALYSYSYSLYKGNTNMPSEVAKQWQANGHLVPIASSQNIGKVLEMKASIEGLGGIVSGNVLGFDKNTPPKQHVIEIAINRTLAAQTNLKNNLFSAATLFPRNLLWNCDDDWCSAMSGLVRLRLLARPPLNCSPVVGHSSECEFTLKFLQRGADWMRSDNHPGEAILQSVVDINTAGTRAKANFVQVAGGWQVDSEGLTILD